MAYKKTDNGYTYLIEINPRMYAQLNALSAKSNDSIQQLSEMAVTLLLVASRNMAHFNPNIFKKKTRKPTNNAHPSSVGDIARNIMENPKKPRERSK